MKPVLAALLALFLTPLLAAAPPRTMRIDYFHTGTATSELFSLDRTVLEPLPWPGRPGRALDDSGLGQYRFEVVDAATGRPLYSRGFCSIFGEWETTAEAGLRARTFSESLRFPAPEAPVRVLLSKRDARNAFHQLWSLTVDPADKFIDASAPPSPGPLITIQQMGDPADKVDFLILGDGYTAAERPQFEQAARRLTEVLFSTSPYREHRQDFNVWALCPAAARSGVARPSTGTQVRSPLGAAYDAFGSERYILTTENRTVRDVASWAPYDCMEILVNGETYGGAGIFGLYSTVAARNLYAPYVFIHEFGHHFAGLADEYYTSEVAYETGKERVEPWQPNVTAEPLNPKWKALLTPGTPLPTPWRHEAFEEASHRFQARRKALRAARRPESELNALFKEEEALETRLLGTDANAGRVGAFEGANYEAKGYYRCQEDCVMFTRDPVPFCAACQAAIERVIRLYTR